MVWACVAGALVVGLSVVGWITLGKPYQEARRGRRAHATTRAMSHTRTALLTGRAATLLVRPARELSDAELNYAWILLSVGLFSETPPPTVLEGVAIVERRRTQRERTARLQRLRAAIASLHTLRRPRATLALETQSLRQRMGRQHAASVDVFDLAPLHMALAHAAAAQATRATRWKALEDACQARLLVMQTPPPSVSLFTQVRRQFNTMLRDQVGPRQEVRLAQACRSLPARPPCQVRLSCTLEPTEPAPRSVFGVLTDAQLDTLLPERAP